MPYEYDIDPERRLIEIRYRGRIGWDELKASLLDFTSHEQFDRKYDQITDLRESVLEFDATVFEELSPLFRELYGGSTGRSAILVNDPHKTLLASIHRMKAEGTRVIEVFSTRAAAKQWLGLPE
jgi:hypothetical protein